MSKTKGPRSALTYRAIRRNVAKVRRRAMRKEGAAAITFASVWAPHGAKVKVAKVSRKRLNPSKHPGANPLHDPNGRKRWTDQATGIVLRGPRNPSRWVPHQGKREKARRIGAL